MTYDAREYLAALTPPKFIAPDGHEYTGRILSHHERAELQAAMAGLAEKANPMMRDTEPVFREVLSAMFPEPAAVDAVMALPPEAVQEAMMHFLACQRPPKRTGPALVVEVEANPVPPAPPLPATAGN